MQLPVNDSTFWVGYWVSNVGGAVLAFTGWKKTTVARYLFAALFAWACWFNLVTVADTPDVYVDYAWLTPVTWYSSFMTGWFADHVTQVVTAISIMQGAIALGMLIGGSSARLAALAAIAFLLGVAPLGLGSAFPAPLLMAVGAWFVFKNTNSRRGKSAGRPS